MSNISIRPMTMDDYMTVAPWFRDPSSAKWLKSVYRMGAYNPYIHELSIRTRSNDLCLGEVEGGACGMVGLSYIDRLDKSAALWYLTAADSRRRGLGATLVSLMIERARSHHGLHSLTASVADGNVASVRILEKNGFLMIGTARECHLIDGKFVDRQMFQLLL